MRFPDFRIFQALNSAQAFEIIDQEKPDILILDLNLNEKLTGFDVQKKALQVIPTVKSLVVTGNVDEDVEKMAGELGIKQVLAKPVSLSTLITLVKELAGI